jgi:hypothetical protein
VKLSSSASASSFSVEASLWGSTVVSSCDLVADGATFVAAAANGAIAASADGVTWTALSGVGAPALNGLAYDGAHVVGVGADGALLNATCAGGTCTNGRVTTMWVPVTDVPLGGGG